MMYLIESAGCQLHKSGNFEIARISHNLFQNMWKKLKQTNLNIRFFLINFSLNGKIR